MNRFMSAVALTAAAMLGTASVRAADIEVIHWWTSGGEQASVKVFADEFNKTGDKWIDSAVAVGETARAAIMNRALGGDPPEAAQFNPGRQYEELIAAGLLLDLTPLAEAEGWADFVRPDETEAPCHIDGKWWCVPVNIHIVNWAWASIPAFKKAGLEVPTTWDQYLADLPKLKEAGITGIAVGGDGGGWQVTQIGNGLLLSILGADTVEKIFKDKDVDLAGGADVLKVFQTMKTLGQYADEGASSNRHWSEATAMLVNGTGALQIMGDWARGDFQLAGKKPGVDYACLPGPLNAGLNKARIAGDIFVFFKQNDADVERAQLALASLMVNPRTQALFNTSKGSVPVRDDVDLSLADDCMKTGLAIFQTAGAVVPDQNVWRNESFATSLNAIFADLFFNAATTAEAAQAQFVELVRNAE